MEKSKVENKTTKVKKDRPKGRKGDFKRKTTETDIKLSLNLDGKGIYDIDTGVPFFNHMLEQFSKHSRFDMTLKAKGDIDVDLHHLIEDTGIVIGGALKELSGDKKGIQRFGSAFVPMDEALVHTVVDFSGRSFFVYKDNSEEAGSVYLIKSLEELSDKYSNFDKEGTREVLIDKFFYVYSNIFFEALCKNALINLHINVMYGSNNHHIVEAVFKSAGIAIADALKVAEGYGIPSTKGSI
ncbi:MAG: imidazoleglycerol-phosphate dehydratase [Candidatus Acidulodesulfobacterium ferriphilum]|jgi:imidazoleglycerol-phosphate dehydratase|uniref:Imidazoleglycerol-phosphate dehydratase n=1 Tax=Candidatus Acidulodesulfobacterium ferriphilum TaxID=2597223 RepID=A0A519B921_9DELT|nr:MAG: imidazoleglycerol-phosphate dehydratase [Candidatus Acidulodesulfobacterium ferriphilum]